MLQYKALAVAFSYPDESFFAHFPARARDRARLVAEYDRLFRAGRVWLYGAEYLADNEFQRAGLLSDIMGFYLAFGLEPDKERPDSITCEMEFMHYLILKRQRLDQGTITNDTKEKADTCRDAESKFFREHLEPAAKQIAAKIASESNDSFYVQTAGRLSKFLKVETKRFGPAAKQN
jgi:TorA maturation chaperone TorD